MEYIFKNDIFDKFQFKTESKVIIAASHIHLHEAVKLSQLNSQINIAAQNCSAYDSGAYTSDISAKMINSCGVEYVILGHSECRDNLKEDNYLLMQKVSQALSNNLHVIFLLWRNSRTKKKISILNGFKKQISESLFHLSSEDMSKIHIAYEPIWAIGTGLTASVNQAQEMHSYIRSILQKNTVKLFLIIFQFYMEEVVMLQIHQNYFHKLILMEVLSEELH